MDLTQQTAARFAQAALGHVAREYPHKLDHVMDGDADVAPPRELHPCFFGSFDWHSCVHGWWTLLTLRRLFPDSDEARAIETLGRETFTTDKLAVELAYAQRPSSRGFERPYGWGWLLYLHHEAARHDEEWAARLEPLARHFAQAFKDYLGVLTYPVFVGTHYNTAFALTLAREVGDDEFGLLMGVITASDSLMRIITSSLGGFLLQHAGTWAPGTLAALVTALAAFAGRHIAAGRLGPGKKKDA